MNRPVIMSLFCSKTVLGLHTVAVLEKHQLLQLMGERCVCNVIHNESVFMLFLLDLIYVCFTTVYIYNSCYHVHVKCL